MQDQHYGDTLSEDVHRRDYTVNAFYYDPIDDAFADELNAYADLESSQLRCIGIADKRFSEDPVRMLRAVYFQAKLGLTPDAQLKQAIKKNAYKISAVVPARMNGELKKLFGCGNAAQMWALLREYQLVKHIFPPLSHLRDDEANAAHQAIIDAWAAWCDQQTAQNRPINWLLCMAAILWQPLQSIRRHQRKGSHYVDRAQKVFLQLRGTVSIKPWQQKILRRIWQLQIILEHCAQEPRNAQHLSKEPCLRDALWLLNIRGRSHPQLNKILNARPPQSKKAFDESATKHRPRQGKQQRWCQRQSRRA